MSPESQSGSRKLNSALGENADNSVKSLLDQKERLATAANQNGMQNFQKAIGEIRYELEIYPKCIYFQMVSKDGF